VQRVRCLYPFEDTLDLCRVLAHIVDLVMEGGRVRFGEVGVEMAGRDEVATLGAEDGVGGGVEEKAEFVERWSRDEDCGRAWSKLGDSRTNIFRCGSSQIPVRAREWLEWSGVRIEGMVLTHYVSA
jgi:hypothetical protein